MLQVCSLIVKNSVSNKAKTTKLKRDKTKTNNNKNEGLGIWLSGRAYTPIMHRVLGSIPSIAKG